MSLLIAHQIIFEVWVETRPVCEFHFVSISLQIVNLISLYIVSILQLRQSKNS